VAQGRPRRFLRLRTVPATRPSTRSWMRRLRRGVDAQVFDDWG